MNPGDLVTQKKVGPGISLVPEGKLQYQWVNHEGYVLFDENGERVKLPENLENAVLDLALFIRDRYTYPDK